MRSPATSRRAGRQHVPAPRPPRLQTVPLPPVPLASSTSQHPRWQPPLSPLPPPSPLGFDAPTQPFTVFSKNPFTRKCNPTEMAALLALMRQVQASSRAASGAPRPLVDDQQRFNLFLALLVYTQAIVGLEEGAELPEALLADEGLRAGLAGMPTLIQDAMDWEARRKLWAIEQREVIFGCREKAVSPGGVVVDPAEYVETKWRLKVGNEEGLGIPQNGLSFMGALPDYSSLVRERLSGEAPLQDDATRPSTMSQATMYAGLNQLGMEMGVFPNESSSPLPVQVSTPGDLLNELESPNLADPHLPELDVDPCDDRADDCTAHLTTVTPRSPPATTTSSAYLSAPALLLDLQDLENTPLPRTESQAHAFLKKGGSGVADFFPPRARTPSGPKASESRKGLRIESPVKANGSGGTASLGMFGAVLGTRARTGEEIADEADGKRDWLGRRVD